MQEEKLRKTRCFHTRRRTYDYSWPNNRILGGGQLGRMMALEAKAMGFKVAVLEPSANSPTAQVADVEVIGAYHDPEAVQKLADQSDVVTFEFENVDAITATILQEAGKLPQGTALLKTTQHRLREKEALEKAGLTVAPYRAVSSIEELRTAIDLLGTPAVLKTCRGGYDGKGQYVIQSKEESAKAFHELDREGVELVLEGFVSFEKEISVIVTRNAKGELQTFPVAENVHEANILKRTIVPAQISAEAEAHAIQMAETFAKSIDLIGTLAVEMFYTSDGEIYVNELAPRPHNSGHYTMNSCNVSQFGQHVRAICDWPLVEPMLHQPVIMDNILGEHVEKALEAIPQFTNAFLHLYGKSEVRTGRKMGHVNSVGKTIEEAINTSKQLNIRMHAMEAAR
ncbi:5-(carboxyamino)imidazole ribonucleotide synthase [Geomicrobium sp. JCM 19055]|uniref:5-(carboxyamino)imidazole ribonucleotide synthase n=1 Tax=Geomicrobium sp. JCM 19055 TaxID=1460649 RepID=UPI0009E0AE56|nr:5-(carboxyamino)imidazole ribonucleotide synthase [Geomicrobium sp. JCM 19055]